MGSACKTLICEFKRMIKLCRSRPREKDNIKVVFKETGCGEEVHLNI
jgi:hypothetical protein